MNNASLGIEFQHRDGRAVALVLDQYNDPLAEIPLDQGFEGAWVAAERYRQLFPLGRAGYQLVVRVPPYSTLTFDWGKKGVRVCRRILREEVVANVFTRDVPELIEALERENAERLEVLERERSG